MMWQPKTLNTNGKEINGFERILRNIETGEIGQNPAKITRADLYPNEHQSVTAEQSNAA